jgi:uncharacterized membrane protein YphA (DoxX/SURF4 family)
MMRVVVLVFTAIVTIFAMNTESSIYKMVENAYKVTLVAAFVPLALACTGSGQRRRAGWCR